MYRHKRYKTLLITCLLCLSYIGLQAQEQEQKPSKFFWGGGVSIAINDYLDIDVSPRVGYRVTPNFSLGLLAKYEYMNLNEDEPCKINTYGGGTFAQYNVSSLFSNQSLPFNIYAHTEYQYLYSEIDWKHQNYTGYHTDDRWYVGAGFSVPFGGRSYFYTTILYDLLTIIKNKADTYRKPVISVGVQF
ncbi:MAG: hypothetical protein LBG19_08805 [Prevotellaceae bacterium]|jgi:hypothetical protein|nr:hypothetical protein [Prevotellaceae bacterium]